MQSLSEAWNRVENWLTAEAPLVRSALRPGTTPAELAAAEESMGLTIPHQLALLLRLHDGAEDTEAGRFLQRKRLLPLREIVSMHSTLCALLDSDDLVGTWWHPQWIPFAANHDAWSRLYLDVRSGAGYGSVSTYFMETGGGGHPWPSLTAYLEELAASLQGGTPMVHHVPRVTDEGLLVWDHRPPAVRPQFARRRRAR
ncbi:SMI1/KNR4 family protein [Actinacidiphila glaucinigra]|uniref:SMI1/KNR4 family protein n=1 Tax=Actinacidiphila glaucinigra TaxID=235986 RepID=UPI002DD8A778|nr:SMI1/KNR4 family protein [Actinacidiphila glaucinigra]WSD58500.1 SMI1/KNR4 family protein [Actinacidiphila glaucinigra]